MLNFILEMQNETVCYLKKQTLHQIIEEIPLRGVMISNILAQNYSSIRVIIVLLKGNQSQIHSCHKTTLILGND